ncbi:MAG: flagellar motor switch protein FliG [Treponema sp.]|nr:flagellar motor switch protein FliG [Treponema sp.]
MYKNTMNQTANPELKDDGKPGGQVKKETQAFYKETKPVKYNDFHLIYGEQGKESKEKSLKDSKYSRVAKFLILIGSNQAAGILAELEPQQVHEISKEIAQIKIIKSHEREEILAEFNTLFSNREFKAYGTTKGGIETARRILYAAKGAEKGEEILNKAIPESKENLFGFLEEFSTEQLAMLLKNESAQTSALILSRMPPKLTADVLCRLPSDSIAEVVLRIAHQKEVSPEVLEQVSSALKEKVRNIAGGAKDIEIDGIQTLAAILKHSGYSFGDRLLSEIEEDDPEIGNSLKDKLFTLNDITDAVDRPIQDKLKTMTEREIAVLLKGRGNEFSEKILSCVSAVRRKAIREEFELLGTVAKRECDTAARDFLAWFRVARERGDILFYSDEDVFV